ncbi:MAG: hypothetical protein FD147_2046 [Chloroflexi bacterium]|nr:MAG: hypothetical protein FD147_2046 [Chloroflexota bacterium]
MTNIDVNPGTVSFYEPWKELWLIGLSNALLLERTGQSLAKG